MLIKVVFILMVLNQSILILLSPTLFLIFVDGLMKGIESKVSSLPSLQLNGLL